MLVSAALRELREIDALDLDEFDTLRLLNEANVELCVRSRWTQATLGIGPTVDGQVAYPIEGTQIREPREVYVGEAPYENSDRRTVARLRLGELALRARGLWWLSFEADGSEAISLYPTPDGTHSLQVIAVVAPGELTAEDSFSSPPDFHHACIEYVQGVSIGGSEDDLERRRDHWEEFERAVARLRARRITKSSGRGAVSMKITGVTG